ncbi:hypothetical protein K523DRAFT_251643 [Schizophyllum commune Tattone D]|nr:hypothetical protein K525DRAFT_206607 [Schizophyllum commune Loenen D]KAI5825184.1 hypothetical protein K523DRAFT_251643 [Schizophyllum commune Tattone D]
MSRLSSRSINLYVVVVALHVTFASQYLIQRASHSHCQSSPQYLFSYTLHSSLTLHVLRTHSGVLLRRLGVLRTSRRPGVTSTYCALPASVTAPTSGALYAEQRFATMFSHGLTDL